jgi:hypothetical protein
LDGHGTVITSLSDVDARPASERVAVTSGIVERGDTVEELIVQNPVARLTRALEAPGGSGAASSSRAPRLVELRGATLGLWWNLKVGGSVALEWLADRFAGEHGTTSAAFYGRYPGAPSLIAECARSSTAVIGATGD